jgi:hypothetical protein
MRARYNFFQVVPSAFAAEWAEQCDQWGRKTLAALEATARMLAVGSVAIGPLRNPDIRAQQMSQRLPARAPQMQRAPRVHPVSAV